MKSEGEWGGRREWWIVREENRGNQQDGKMRERRRRKGRQGGKGRTERMKRVESESERRRKTRGREGREKAEEKYKSKLIGMEEEKNGDESEIKVKEREVKREVRRGR